MRWAREKPEEMSRISRLPVSEQNEALRLAIVEDDIKWDGKIRCEAHRPDFHASINEAEACIQTPPRPLVERTTVVQFSPRGELVKERAQHIVDGTYTVWKVAHGGEGFALDLTTSTCALCKGSFAPIGWAYTFHDEHGTNLQMHGGCFRDAPNWAGVEYDDPEGEAV